MLGSRTKQITTYGKRRNRVLNDDRDPRLPPLRDSIFDDLPPMPRGPVASRMKKRENSTAADKPKSKSKTPSPKPKPKVLHVSKTRPQKRPSPPKKKAMLPQIRRIEEGDAFTPSRRPLGVRPLNTPGKRVSTSPPLKSFVEIVVLDGEGATISTERRVSKRHILVDTDDEDDVIPVPKPPRRLRQVASKRIESDSDESDSDTTPIVLASKPDEAYSYAASPNVSCNESVDMSIEVVITPLPLSPARMSVPLPSRTPLTPPPRTQFQRVASPFPRARRLTPITQRNPLFLDDDDETEDSDLSLSDLSDELTDEVLSAPPAGVPVPAEAPAYLGPLLSECKQQGVHEFSAFIKSFPFDPLVAGQRGGFKKIGEASYSEVYGIGQVVLKVIPLRDETQRRLRPAVGAGDNDAETPFATDVKDVLKEIIVTEAMGELRGGFVHLLRTYIVRGRYPQQLLQLWDEYHERVGSEGIRPDTFGVAQAYAIIVLPNGGPDLEAYAFGSKGGWKQAASIFWQVAKTLGHAEQLVSFEHRDLHLGQILVKEDVDSAVSRPLQAVNLNQKMGKGKKPMMDDTVHGVRATVIDLGLSRMDAGDGSGGEMVHWTPFEDEIFEGEGDYQFDIYRYMRDHNGDDWEAFNPLTNALWLHYLVVKLLKSKGLRAPVRRKSQAPTPPSAGFTDRECYECLLDVEEWLGQCVAGVIEAAAAKAGRPKPRGRKKKATVLAETHPALLRGPLCAGEVVEYGVKKGWVERVVI
uniref:non-specific serine/threonine protein kinase n=1 Tax=Mycena chlorophos TaxID=658473 RepID=A0ABQ0LR88_MYCCL|nr:other/Haspin protein kinase [Mycena chlorophos]